MSDAIIQPSFAAGELAPSLYGRVDLSKYHSGAALLRNFFVDYRGGASTRPGTQFVARAKLSTSQPRLIPFTFSTVQTYVLELGNQYMRVHMNGAPVLEPSFTVTAAAQNDPCQITASGGINFANGDTVFIAGVGGMVQLNDGTFLVQSVNTGAGTFTLTDLDGNPIDATSFGAFTAGGSVARVFTLATPYLASDLPLLKFTQSADTMTLCHPSYLPMDLTRTQHYAWTLTSVTFAAQIAAPTGATATSGGGSGTSYSYQVTAISLADGEESLPSATASCSSSTGASNTIAWHAVAGAVQYNIYKASANAPVGALFGLIGSTSGLSFIDGNIESDFTNCPPQHQNPFANAPVTAVTVTAGGSAYSATPVPTINTTTGSGAVLMPIVVSGAIADIIVVYGGQNYAATDTVTIADSTGSGAAATLTLGPATGNNPGCDTYFQQRKIFAASLNNPETIWMTQPGSFKNMDISSPSRDDDAITLTLASQQVNAVKSLVPMSGGLIALTANGAWQINGGVPPPPLTPSGTTALPQSYNGCSDVPPIVVGYDILYVQNKGSIVRDLSYNFYVNVYTGADVSALANHLFFGHQITEWTWAEEPYKIIWCVREDGILLSLTYLKEQEIYAWAHSDTQGFFRSVASISEGSENAVYVVAQRFINNEWLYYVERLHTRQIAGDPTRGIPGDVRQAWCVDAGLALPLTFPAATLTPPALTASTAGEGLPSFSGSGVFTASGPVTVNVGDVLEINGGVGTVTAGVSAGTQFSATIIQPMLSLLPAPSGSWSCTTPVTTVSGLQHLNGETVAILADGNVQPQQVVTSGALTLQQPATRIVVGLPFQAQIQTLPLDVEGGATIQGKRKKISAATVRVVDTRGLKVGPSFTVLRPVKELVGQPAGQPIALVTGDVRVNIDPLWQEAGQIVIQQDNPLPASVLAVIPEIMVGDTAG